jgi:hypothetical protein
VGAEGTQPAEHAKAERDGLNRYRGLHHLTRVHSAAREELKPGSKRGRTGRWEAIGHATANRSREDQQSVPENVV